MAWPTNFNRLCIAYDNRINRAECYGVPTLTNMTEQVGFAAANLTYDDPSVLFKGTPVSGSSDVSITFTLNNETACSVIGIANHNLVSQGYTRIALECSTDGSTWTDVGGGTFPQWASIVPPNNYAQNPNFFFRFVGTTVKDYWRLTFSRASGTRLAVTIGMVFLGSYYEVPTNPANGQIFHRQKPSIEIVRGGGGAAFVNPNIGKRYDSGELHFRRISQTQAAVFSDLLHGRNCGRIVGLIHPEATSYMVAPGIQHAFCYIMPVEYGAQSGYAYDAHKYDVSMEWEGAC